MRKRNPQSARTKRICAALFIGVALASVLSAVNDSTGSGMLLRGDFPAFYAAGELSYTGDLKQLYDMSKQQEVQNLHWPSLGGQYLAFAYPPFVAVLFQPFAALPPLLAKAFFTILMLLSLWKASSALQRLGLAINNCVPTTFFLLTSVLPVTCAILAGQNTALSMMLIFWAIVFLEAQDRKNDQLAGLCLGLLAYKPHLSIVAFLFLFSAGKLLACRSMLVVYLLYFGLAWSVFGPEWLEVWLNVAGNFAAQDIAVNGYQMLSLSSLMYSLSGFGTVLPNTLQFAGAAFSMILLLSAAGLVYFARKKNNLETIAFTNCLLCSMVFLAPLTLFYEFGLLYIPLARTRLFNSGIGAVIVLWLLVTAAALFREELMIQPLALISGIIFFSSFFRLIFPDSPSHK